MKLPLSLALSPYDHVRDLRAEGLELNAQSPHLEEIFFRFTRFREWDASEMSFGKTISILANDAAPDIVALPVFVSRVFRHSSIYVGPRVSSPKDLEGKRVGVPEWAQTAAIYTRGILQHEYGVDLGKIDWVQAGVRQPGRIEKVQLHLPPGLRLTPVRDKSLTQMLASGELDAVLSAREIPGRRLFEDYRTVELEYFRKTRIFPIMHLVVVRRDVYEKNRWVARNLYKGFEEAKNASLARMLELGLSHFPLPWLAQHSLQWRETMGSDFWPYGVDANRPTLEAFVQYGFEQGVCKRKLSVDEMFAPETRESFKI
jgi:4,5-dihydroxyphthalate decarboxylase